MILLDSDHVSILVDPRESKRADLLSRLQTTSDAVCLPVVVVEEHLRGWLAAIHKVRDVYQQVVPYLRLIKVVDFSRAWPIINWNEPAADHFTRLRRCRLRLGTQDLKIASIALAHDATLLSANLVDFERVPDLRVEDWLHG
jgi:tRNA(fMet)-specific endonuclease VapC